MDDGKGVTTNSVTTVWVKECKVRYMKCSNDKKHLLRTVVSVV